LNFNSRDGSSTNKEAGLSTVFAIIQLCLQYHVFEKLNIIKLPTFRYVSIITDVIIVYAIYPDNNGCVHFRNTLCPHNQQT